MKARFAEEQQPVEIVNAGGRNYVFICLNPEQKQEEPQDENSQPAMCIEYDYNEFIDDGAVDLTDVMARPEKYLEYVPQQPKTLEETVSEQNETIKMLTECLLEVSEMVYA